MHRSLLKPTDACVSAICVPDIMDSLGRLTEYRNNYNLTDLQKVKCGQDRRVKMGLTDETVVRLTKQNLTGLPDELQTKKKLKELELSINSIKVR